jgi:hypothetical protein
MLNEPGFSVADSGPLHGPIRKFTIRRDERLTLLIDTKAGQGAQSSARAIPPGTARINVDKVELENLSGAKAILSAADTTRRIEKANTVRETARIHELTVTSIPRRRLFGTEKPQD